MLLRLGIVFILCTFFSVQNSCFSQNNTADIDYPKMEVRLIELAVSGQKQKLPVSSIVVHDSRYDTTAVGFLKTTNNALLKLRLKNGAEKDIADYYSQLLSIDTANQENTVLHCYIKKLQLTDAIMVDDKRRHGVTAPHIEEKSGIHFKVEFYTQQTNVFVALFRFDTTFYGDPTIWTAGAAYLEQALMASINKAARLNWKQTILQGKRLSQEDIISYNENRFQIPALQETPAKGVYPNFEAFLQNKPLEVSFSVKNRKQKDQLLVKGQNGKDSSIVEFWGYCDGKDRYILSAQNFFKLTRNANGFLLYGVNRIKSGYVSFPVVYESLGAIGTMISTPRFKKNLSNQHIFQLDMETGNIY